MKPKSSRAKRYARLTKLTMLREMADELRVEYFAENDPLEENGDNEGNDGDEQDNDTPLNDVHGLLALDPDTVTYLE